MSCKDGKRKLLLFLLVIVILIISSFVAEAALLSGVKGKIADWGNTAKGWKENYIGKERITNYAIISVVLIIASVLLFKDKIGEGNSKYAVWVGLVIIAIIITVNMTQKNEYIWQKDIVVDGKAYFLGDPTRLAPTCGKEGVACNGDGAYCDARKGIQRCRQGVLRTNQGKGLPAFLISLIILAIIFGKYKDTLGFGDNKKLMYGIAILIAAIISNGGAEKSHLLMMGGWILVAILYFSFKEKMPEKAPLAFGLAYACIESLANLFQTTLLWGVGPEVVTGSTILLNFVWGGLFGLLFSTAFGEKGAMKYWWEKKGEKRQEQIAEMCDNGDIGKAFLKALPGIGYFVPGDEEEAEKMKEGMSKFRDWLPWMHRGAGAEAASHEEAGRLSHGLDAAKAYLVNELEKLRGKEPYSRYFPRGSEPTLDQIISEIGKLDAEEMSGIEGTSNVRKKVEKVIMGNRAVPPDQKKDYDAFVDELMTLLFQGDGKHVDKSYINTLIALKNYAAKKEMEDRALPEAVSARVSSMFNLEEADRKVEEKKAEFVRSFSKKVKEELVKTIERYKIEAIPEAIRDADAVIAEFESEFGFAYPLQQDAISNWLIEKRVLPVWPQSIMVEDPSKSEEAKKAVNKIWVRLISMFAAYATWRHQMYNSLRNIIDKEWENLTSDNYHGSEWEKILEMKRTQLIDQLGQEMYRYAQRGAQPVEHSGRKYSGLVKPGRINISVAKELAGKVFSEVFSRVESEDSIPAFLRTGIRGIFENYVWAEGVRNYVDYENKQRQERNERRQSREHEIALNRGREERFGSDLEGWEDLMNWEDEMSSRLMELFSDPILDISHEFLSWMSKAKKIRESATKAKTYASEAAGPVAPRPVQTEPGRIFSLIPKSERLFITKADAIVDYILLSRDLVSDPVLFGAKSDNDVYLAPLYSAVAQEHCIIYQDPHDTHKRAMIKQVDSVTKTIIRSRGRESILNKDSFAEVADGAEIQFGENSNFVFVVSSKPITHVEKWDHHIVYELPSKKDVSSESMTLENAEALLNVKASTSKEEIKKAYKRWQITGHPDIVRGKALKEGKSASEAEAMAKAAEGQFKKATKAYELLMNK